MEIILRQAVENLGHPGDVVTVKNGYARNFLLPRGMAFEATPGNLKRIAAERSRLEAAENDRRGSASDLAKKLEEVQLKGSAAKTNGEQVREVNGIKVLTHLMDSGDAGLMRKLADRYRDQLKSGVVGLGAVTADGKALILVAATKDLVEKGLKAGDLVKQLAATLGGSGGGKPDMAQAGGPDAAKLPQALERLYELVKV